MNYADLSYINASDADFSFADFGILFFADLTLAFMIRSDFCNAYLYLQFCVYRYVRSQPKSCQSV